MKLEACAEFSADFPHDFDEDEKGFVQTPCRGAAEAIAEMIGRLGYNVSGPDDGGDHGWTLSFRHKKQFVWIEVSAINNYIIQIIESGPFFTFFKKPQFISSEFLTRLNAEMAKDPRFKKVLWFTKKDFLSGRGGKPEPVIWKG